MDGVGVLALGAIAAVAYVVQTYGREILIVGGLALAAWVAFKMFGSSKSHDSAVERRSDATDSSRTEVGSFASEPTRVATHSEGRSFGIPSRPALSAANRDGSSRWQPSAATPTVQGRQIGGMVYVGDDLLALGESSVEPALIDPTLKAARGPHDLSVRRTDYWPSYSTISSEARGAYLDWLSAGRKDPRADIGLVFLFFYGLERRALADALTSPQAAAESAAIKAEVERLLAIYTESGSFQHYARGFVDLLTARDLPVGLYRSAPTQGKRLEFREKLALAQCAQDGAQLPVAWALAWLERDTSERLPLAARRCPDQFRQLFALRYREAHGDGLVLPRNKTRLKLDYTPASASFRGWPNRHELAFDLPDASVLTSPLKKLRLISEQCGEELAAYARRMGKEGANGRTLEAVVDLPYAIWPDEYRKPIERVRDTVAKSGRPLAVPFTSVKGWLPPYATMGKALWREVVERLAEAGVGVEPDPAVGGATPDDDTKIAFFPLGAEGRAKDASPRYRAATLTLQLATAVAGADGAVDDVERTRLTSRLEDWLHLDQTEKNRLHAHLRGLLAAPPKITGLKRQVEAMDAGARGAVGAFVVSIAQADGVITKTERKLLERIFRLLGLEVSTLPVALAGMEPAQAQAAAPSVAQGRPGFTLDPERVKALQAETERVSAMLTGIFTADEEPAAATVPAVASQAEAEPAAPGLWGLDGTHAGFATALLERTQWSRSELEEMAEDRELMLDGALERINEACLDATGEALLEGSDPVDVNRSVLHKEAA
jgi:tellurite resistance protein